MPTQKFAYPIQAPDSSSIATDNGAVAGIFSISEEITLDTGAAFTDSTADLLPGASLILAVTGYITVAITGGGVTQWELGDPTTQGRFHDILATLTIGASYVGLKHLRGSITTDAAGPTQATADKVRITLDGTPSGGKVRVTTFYIPFTSATS